LSHRTDTRSDGTEKKKKKKREREGNGERDGGVRIREIIENEDSWGKVIIPFKQGPIKRIILVPAGYTDGELVQKYSYMGLALKKEWFFMIFDFMDKILIGRLIGGGGSVKKDFITRTLSNAKSTRAKLSIRFSQPDSPSGWCVVQGDVEEDVLFCSELIMKKVSELENFWLTSTSSSAATTTSAKRKGSGTGTVSSRENDKKKKKKSATTAAAAENNFGDRLKNKPEELKAKEADEDQSSSEDDALDEEEKEEQKNKARLEKECLGDVLVGDSRSDDDYGSDDDEDEEVEKEEVKKTDADVQEASISVVAWIDDKEDENIDKPDVPEENNNQNSSRTSKEKKNAGGGKISILDYCEKVDEKIFGDENKSETTAVNNKTKHLERLLCDDKREEFVAHVKEDLSEYGGANNIAFNTIGDVPLPMRTEVTNAFAQSFGIFSGKEREDVVKKVDAKVTDQFGKIVDEIDHRVYDSNADVLRAKNESTKLAEKFITDKVKIKELLEGLVVLFDGTYADEQVEQATKAFKEGYRRVSKRGGPPECAKGNTFCLIYGAAKEVFEEVRPHETDPPIKTGVHNAMPLSHLNKQLPDAFKKAKEKGKIIALATILDGSSYAVSTIDEEKNNEEIEKFLKDPMQYLEQQDNAGKQHPIPLTSDFSIFKERLSYSQCFENPVADHATCLKKWLQHTVKHMEEVGRKTFMAALTPGEQEQFVIIEVHIDMTRCRAPGSHVFEELIKKYTKREIRFNLKRAMDFAMENSFKIVISSRWIFKRLVKYLRNSESTIGKEYVAAGEATDLLLDDGENISLSAAERDAVLNSTLEAARGRIFRVAVEKRNNNNNEKKRLEVYNHYHLSQALRSGGNANMFAIAVVKIVAVYGLPVSEAIKRARGTYYFNNISARSVVLDFIQEVKRNDDSLQNAGRLTYHDVSFFVNPVAFRQLLCLLHSLLPQANGGVVDANDDVEQFKAWKQFNKEAPDSTASMMKHWSCSFSRLLGIFASATFECFRGDGKKSQYNFRNAFSIAFLVWRQNLTFARRNFHLNKEKGKKEGRLGRLEDERLREEENSVKHAAGEPKNISSLTKTSAKEYPKFPLRRGIDKEREEEKKAAASESGRNVGSGKKRANGNAFVSKQNLSLTEEIDSNVDKTFAKPNENWPPHSEEEVENIKRDVLESGESGKPIAIPIRREWADIEKFLKEEQEKNEYKEMAQNLVDWEKIRQRTSLACIWKYHYRQESLWNRAERKQSGKKHKISARVVRAPNLYEKNKASGVWYFVSERGPAMTKRLVELYPRN